MKRFSQYLDRLSSLYEPMYQSLKDQMLAFSAKEMGAAKGHVALGYEQYELRCFFCLGDDETRDVDCLPDDQSTHDLADGLSNDELIPYDLKVVVVEEDDGEWEYEYWDMYLEFVIFTALAAILVRLKQRLVEDKLDISGLEWHIYDDIEAPLFDVKLPLLKMNQTGIVKAEIVKWLYEICPETELRNYMIGAVCFKSRATGIDPDLLKAIGEMDEEEFVQDEFEREVVQRLAAVKSDNLIDLAELLLKR